MKIRNILIGGIGMLALTACNDFLDVDAPSKQTTELVFSSSTEANQALNGIYAKVLNDNTFGRYAYYDLMLNSDVDYTATSNEVAQINSPKRYDCTSESGTVEKFWNALYSGVETANEFIYNLENSEMYKTATGDAKDELTQMMGEAKVMRAMFYHELLCYWGDVPFSLVPTYVTQDFVLPVTSRDEIYMQLINDLKDIAPLMKSATALTDGIERVSQEACWGMIARMALQAGGYSLRPVEGNSESYGKMARPANSAEFYQIAREYADKVIQSGTFSLNKSYQQVFVDECNFVPATAGDDPMFELAFGEGSTGQVGYYQGPKLESSEGLTPHVWGEAHGGAQLEAFYRYKFDDQDLRRDYVTNFWYYNLSGLPVMHTGYSSYNNKWSKLWNNNGLGANTTGATGINFPYMRYADILLVFAEAENELNGPTQAAQDALKAVRKRAFASENHSEKVEAYVASVAGDKQSFLTAVLDERAFELAGENSRWKDLVRNNLYAEKMFYTFIRYYSAAINAQTSSDYDDMIAEYDGIQWQEVLPYSVYSCIIKNPADKAFYTNTQMPVRYVVNRYNQQTIPQLGPENYMLANELPYEPISERDITGSESSSSTINWTETAFYNWCEDAGYPKAQVLYSLYGFIRGDINSNIILMVDGKETKINPVGYDIKNLPVLRYILPYPSEAIARSNGVYTQKYGYK